MPERSLAGSGTGMPIGISQLLALNLILDQESSRPSVRRGDPLAVPPAPEKGQARCRRRDEGSEPALDGLFGSQATARGPGRDGQARQGHSHRPPEQHQRKNRREKGEKQEKRSGPGKAGCRRQHSGELAGSQDGCENEQKNCRGVRGERSGPDARARHAANRVRLPDAWNGSRRGFLVGPQRQVDERELRESGDGRREFWPAQRRGVRCRT